MADYSLDLTPDQTNARPIKVAYSFTVDIDPRVGMVIAADFGTWLATKGYLDVSAESQMPGLAAEFIEQWPKRGD